jgi:hypothetical protein
MATEPSNPTTTQPPGLKERERAAGLSINESAPAIARATRAQTPPRRSYSGSCPTSPTGPPGSTASPRSRSRGRSRWAPHFAGRQAAHGSCPPSNCSTRRTRSAGGDGRSGHARSTYGGSRRRDQERGWKPRSLSKAGSSLLRPLMRRVLRRGVDTAIADLKRKANAVSSTGPITGGNTSVTFGDRALSSGAVKIGR